MPLPVCTHLITVCGVTLAVQIIETNQCVYNKIFGMWNCLTDSTEN